MHHSLTDQEPIIDRDGVAVDTSLSHAGVEQVWGPEVGAQTKPAHDFVECWPFVFDTPLLTQVIEDICKVLVDTSAVFHVRVARPALEFPISHAPYVQLSSTFEPVACEAEH